MNERSDADRLLRYWMEDGPATMPDRVVDVVADRIRRQPQRHAWPFQRRSTMTTPIKLIAALAAVVVVALIGYNLLPPGPASVGSAAPTAATTPSPSPTAAAAATSKPTCDDPAFSCAGPLSAGDHSSTDFKPALSFRVPAGWTNTLDRDRTYTLNQRNGAFFFQVLSQVAVPQQNASCAAERKADVGTTMADFVTYLTTHPGLGASTPDPVTVGGYSGTRVSVHVNTAWTATCPNSIGPAVVLLTDSGATPSRSVWIDDQYTTFTILDVGGETVIIRLESGPTAAANEADQTIVQPIIDSFTFTPRP